RFIEVEPGHSLTMAPLRIDERILHYLAGVNLPDQRLQSILQAGSTPDWIAEEHKNAAAESVRALRARAQNPPVLHFCGDDPQGQEDAASVASQEIGRQLFTLRMEDLPAMGPDLEQISLLWQREAVLLPGALLLQCGSGTFSASARYLAERLPVPL